MDWKISTSYNQPYNLQYTVVCFSNEITQDLVKELVQNIVIHIEKHQFLIKKNNQTKNNKITKINDALYGNVG